MSQCSNDSNASCACSGTAKRSSKSTWIAAGTGIIAGFALLIAVFVGTQPAGAQPESTAPATQEAKPVMVRLETSMGNIDIELNAEKAPLSVENFVQYVEDGHYDGTIFHRVISNFMIQGGGFDENMNQKPTREGVKNEWRNGLSNVRGSIAMARLGNQPDSGTAQFFINVTDNAFLDQPRDGAGYAVFGKVVEGMDVVDAIRAVPTTAKGAMRDVPVDAVVIKKASVLAEAEG